MGGSKTARQERLKYLADPFDVNTDIIAPNAIEPSLLYKNTENFFTSVEVPVGLAGPLVVHHRGETTVRCAPLATTEGALVASCCRGAKALNRSGGVRVHFVQQQVQRDPNFICATVSDALKLSAWLDENGPALRGRLLKTTRRTCLWRTIRRALRLIAWSLFPTHRNSLE